MVQCAAEVPHFGTEAVILQFPGVSPAESSLLSASLELLSAQVKVVALPGCSPLTSVWENLKGDPAPDCGKYRIGQLLLPNPASCTPHKCFPMSPCDKPPAS